MDTQVFKANVSNTQHGGDSNEGTRVLKASGGDSNEGTRVLKQVVVIATRARVCSRQVVLKQVVVIATRARVCSRQT